MPVRNFDIVAVGIDVAPLGSVFTLNREEIGAILSAQDLTSDQKVKCFSDLFEKTSKAITLSSQIAIWLYSNWDDEGIFLFGQLNANAITDDEKMSRGALSFKLLKGGSQEYSKEELDLLKRVSGKRGSVPFVFQLRNYLLETEAADLKALKEKEPPKE